MIYNLPFCCENFDFFIIYYLDRARKPLKHYQSYTVLTSLMPLHIVFMINTTYVHGKTKLI